MILHNNPTALIEQGNTLTDPKFQEAGTLKTFDYVVADPPFSDKRWSTGLNPLEDPYERFKPFGTPPAKQGDYAYLLHIIRSLKTTGRGACILPHGVLFRGRDPPQSDPQGLRQRHHRTPGESLLRHRHPRLHRRRG
jgi:type I restriction enzyme M protein